MRWIPMTVMLTLCGCSTWPDEGEGGMAEHQSLLLAMFDTQDKELAPDDGLRFEITLLKHQLELLILEGAKLCFPASVAKAKLTEQRMMREFVSGLRIDAANQVEIQQYALHILEMRLDTVLASGACKISAFEDDTLITANHTHEAAEPSTVEQQPDSLAWLLAQLNSNNQFAFNSSKLTPAYQHQLTRFAPLLQQSAMQIEVIGHTDEQGQALPNLQLSLARAQAVTEKLLALGIAANRIHQIGVGEQSPYLSGSSIEHQHSNRRVTIRLIPQAVAQE